MTTEEVKRKGLKADKANVTWIISMIQFGYCPVEKEGRIYYSGLNEYEIEWMKAHLETVKEFIEVYLNCEVLELGFTDQLRRTEWCSYTDDEGKYISFEYPIYAIWAKIDKEIDCYGIVYDYD